MPSKSSTTGSLSIILRAPAVVNVNVAGRGVEHDTDYILLFYIPHMTSTAFQRKVFLMVGSVSWRVSRDAAHMKPVTRCASRYVYTFARRDEVHEDYSRDADYTAPRMTGCSCRQLAFHFRQHCSPAASPPQMGIRRRVILVQEGAALLTLLLPPYGDRSLHARHFADDVSYLVFSVVTFSFHAIGRFLSRYRL